MGNGKEIYNINLLPVIYHNETNQPIEIPSLLGRDIIGNDFNLFYGEKVYLEKD